MNLFGNSEGDLVMSEEPDVLTISKGVVLRTFMSWDVQGYVNLLSKGYPEDFLGYSW